MAQTPGGSGLPPTPTRHRHAHRFLAVLWDWEAAKPQLQQNEEGTGEYRVEKEV